MTDPEDIVSSEEDISLRRDPGLGRALVSEYEFVDSEQDAIRRAMRERVRWGQQGILPEQLLATLKQFVESSSGEFHGDADGDRLVFRCAETGAELELEDKDSGEISLELEEDDEEC